MTGMLNALADSILAKKFEACSLQELEELHTNYPYAAAIHFLYTQKLKEGQSEGYNAQLQKTLLYYNNPLLINYLLNKDGDAVPASDISTNALPQQKYLPENISIEEDFVETVVVEDYPILLPEAGIIDIQTQDNIENEIIPETESIDEEEAFQPEIENDNSYTEDTTPQPANDLPNNYSENIEEETSIIEEEAGLPPLPEFKIDTIDPSKEELSFTPYHTIDYFAAEGIKLSEEQNNNDDRFGSQLKSFTQWLKQMKRLPGAQPAAAQGNDSAIEKMAAQSLFGDNAQTETMAEVWIKQGDVPKAIDIYKKLSLQNPSKSAYFAAKIDHLKT